MIIKRITRGQLILSLIFSMLFSLALVVGRGVHYVGIRAGMKENYISFDGSSVIIWIILVLLLTPFVVFLFDLQKRHPLYEAEEAGQNGRKHNDRLFFLAAWCIIAAFRLPYLLTFYPGGLVGDGIEVVRMAITPGIPSSSHWSVLYALIVRAVLRIGDRLFHSLEKGLFLYAVLESIAYSGMCAALCCALRRRFSAHKILSYLTVALFSVSGFFATYSMTFWADGIFSGMLVFLCLWLWNFAEQGTEERFGIWGLARLVFLELVVCLWRNNGIYIVGFMCVGMVVLMKKRAIRSAALGCMVIIITLMITGPVYDALGISRDSVRESVSVPLQQMAAAINSGYPMSSEQKEVLYSVAPEDVWKNNYCPCLSDDIKFKIDQNYLNGHMGDFLHVWASMMLPNLKVYIQAYLMQTIGFWKVNSFQGLYWDYWYGIQDNYNYGLEERDLIKEITGYSIRPFLVSCMRFISSGTVVWIMIYCLFSILYQGNDLRRLLVLLPLIGCWLTVMVAAPIAFAYRYVLVLAMALPVMILLPQWHTPAMKQV